MVIEINIIIKSILKVNADRMPYCISSLSKYKSPEDGSVSNILKNRSLTNVAKIPIKEKARI